MRNHPAANYLARVANIFIEMVFLLLVSGISCAALLYVGDMFWFLYLETPMGNRFCVSFPDRAFAIERILSFDIFKFAIDLTLAAFLICMAVGTFSRFFHINRHFYLSMGFFSKCFFWGAPLTAGVTFYINETYDLKDPGLTAIFAIVPTFILFMNCFKHIEHMVPELGYLFRSTVKLIRRGLAFAHHWTHTPDYEDSSFTYDRFRKKIAAYQEKTRQ